MPAARAARMSQTLSPTARARRGSIEAERIAVTKTSPAGLEASTSSAVV
jgi:hypothetical protein